MDNFIRKLFVWAIVLITIPIILAFVLFAWFMSCMMWIFAKSLAWRDDK